MRGRRIILHRLECNISRFRETYAAERAIVDHVGSPFFIRTTGEAACQKLCDARAAGTKGNNKIVEREPRGKERKIGAGRLLFPKKHKNRFY